MNRQMNLEMPPALARRPQWKGMPIPFTTLVGLTDGVPNFKTTDTAAWEICLEEKICALCGEELPYWVWYLGSEDHVRKEVVFDLAMHRECAEWACVSCPYIALGRAYGDHVRPTAGAKIKELCPRNELGNEGVPMFLFRARRDNARKVWMPGLEIHMVTTGTVWEVIPVERRAEVVRV